MLRVSCIGLIFPSIFVTAFFVFGAVGCLIASILCDYVAKKCVFTLRIACCGDVFSINKVTIDGEEKEIFSCLNNEIDELEYRCDGKNFYGEDFSSQNKTNGCENLAITAKNRKILISADAYTYAIVAERRKNGDISR